MRQKGTVIGIKGNTGEIARVRVLRSAMCEGCESRTEGKACACSVMLGNAREMIVDADNRIGACPGEDVEIETDTGTVLFYAAVVFLVPLFGALLFYLIGRQFFSAPYAPSVCAAVGFVFSFIPALIVDRVNRKKTPHIRIVAVNRCETSRMD